jgi:protein-disulfide isomerase
VSRRVEQKLAARVVRGNLARQHRRQRILWMTIGALVILVGATLGVWKLYRGQQPPAFAMPRHVTNDGGDRGGIMAADRGGAIRVDVYQDFGCERCRQFVTDTTGTLNKLIVDKKIKLIWHPVSLLDARSNPPGYSTRAANAVACAGNISTVKMKIFGEALYNSLPPEGTPGPSDDELIDLAGRIGIINPAFAACVRDVGYRQWINNVTAKATARGITETPIVYVNGKLVPLAGPDTVSTAVASEG